MASLHFAKLRRGVFVLFYGLLGAWLGQAELLCSIDKYANLFDDPVGPRIEIEVRFECAACVFRAVDNRSCAAKQLAVFSYQSFLVVPALLGDDTADLTIAFLNFVQQVGMLSPTRNVVFLVEAHTQFRDLATPVVNE